MDPLAQVNPKAELGEGVTVGPFSIIEEDVIIGPGTRVASHVLIARGARIGASCQIHHGAVLSTIPQDMKFAGEETTLEIGDRTIVREYATLNRGTKDRWKTIIGHDCLIMAYVHVAHDCIIGNHVILANAVNMAGHVIIEDYANIGGLVPIHQFVRVGTHAFVGGGYRIAKDVPPYVLASGEPLKYAGLNVVGLKRRGFSSETLAILKKAYKFIYRSNLNVSQALEKIKSELEITREIQNIIKFIENSQRGIIR
ncbi:MAG: acyl-ACP--UDP-N-acetylglucosamine O-acyltransferase [Calditrichaeota bacterium]|nr:MAG: acyl-ACP--UDP-N-acetylglucosamine O-acyltransferase [Calditrichota bacterium]